MKGNLEKHKSKYSLEKPPSQGKEMYSTIKDYSEYSTIQGVIYIFQTNQTQIGKVFWSMVIIAMLALGTYWSVCAYQDWLNNPVMTTIKTSALSIKEINFPAVTICGQGMNADIVTAGLTLSLKSNHAIGN
jgi:hypothetical protein